MNLLFILVYFFNCFKQYIEENALVMVIAQERKFSPKFFAKAEISCNEVQIVLGLLYS